jgi:pimeloyl-ACP methyl ester carboxylesterase
VERLVFVDGAVREAGSPGGGSIVGIPIQVGALADFPPFRRWGQLLLRSLLTRQRMAEVFRSAYFVKSAATPEVEEAYLQVLKMKDWDLALLGVLRDSGESALKKPLAAITAPSCILWGENDPWIPLERGQALHAALAGSRLSVVPETGHLPMEEAPDEFNRLLFDCLGAAP